MLSAQRRQSVQLLSRFSCKCSAIGASSCGLFEASNVGSILCFVSEGIRTFKKKAKKQLAIKAPGDAES